MLRQLARLGRAVPSISPRAWTVAVYASANDDTVTAREAGFEGVACVDDAARALELYGDLWRQTGLAWARRWCDGLLDFVLAMQDDDGRWVNFIRDWEGTPNREGRTSRAAADSFWQARAMLALARTPEELDDGRVAVALERGLPHLLESSAPSDVRSLHILTVLALLARDDRPAWRAVLNGWCDELVACSRDGVLMNSVMERGEPHLWAHFEESALADASTVLARPPLLRAARRSADALYTDVVNSGFDRPSVSPFDVATTCDAMRRVAMASGEPAYLDLARQARAWFDGRNPAGRAVYDRVKGRVADGIDDGRLNENSGAESNIVTAQALFGDVLATAERFDPALLGGPPA
ncbi:MAG: hypothetical protein ABSC34_10455 [Acidimicrobiales bacterium]